MQQNDPIKTEIGTPCNTTPTKKHHKLMMRSKTSVGVLMRLDVGWAEGGGGGER